MKQLTITLFTLALCVSFLACGGDDGEKVPALSCGSVMAHYHSQGCFISFGADSDPYVLSEPEAVGLCEDVQTDAKALGGSCPSASEAYFACLGTIAAQACNGCDAELTALDPCLQ